MGGASSKAFFTTYIIYILKRYPLIKKGTINLLVNDKNISYSFLQLWKWQYFRKTVLWPIFLKTIFGPCVAPVVYIYHLKIISIIFRMNVVPIVILSKIMLMEIH